MLAVVHTVDVFSRLICHPVIYDLHKFLSRHGVYLPFCFFSVRCKETLSRTDWHGNMGIGVPNAVRHDEWPVGCEQEVACTAKRNDAPPHID